MQRLVSRPLLWTALTGILLTGCGPARRASPPPNPLPQVRIAMPPKPQLSLLPFYVAESLNLFRDHGIVVKPSAAPPSASGLWAGPPGTVWPMAGIVGLRPDICLVAPRADPHFRLRALRGLALYYVPQASGAPQLIRALLKMHQVAGYTLTPLSFAQVRTAWRQKMLPWVVVSAPEWQQLRQVDPQTTVLAWFGASSGPVPYSVIAGDSPRLIPVLAALNIALWYLHTTSPTMVARLVNDRFHLTVSQMAGVITVGDRADWWPATTWPDAAAYRRGWQLHATIPESPPWPPYGRAVVTNPARAALAVP